MARKSAVVAARNAGIVKEFTDEARSLTYLVNKYGVSLDTIRNVLRQANVKAEVGRKSVDPRSHDTMAPLSKLHQQIGARLGNYRLFKSTLGMHELALQLRMTQPKLRAAELGAFDFTLAHLIAIASLLDTTVVELTTEKDLVHSA